MRMLIAGTAAAVLLLAGCSSGADASDEEPTDAGSTSAAVLPADTTITYSFQDSSVPPQYHRSYVLTVTQDESTIVVDSYGDVLAEETVATSPEVWQGLSAGAEAIADLSPAVLEDGCTGGTSFDVSVTVPEESLVQLSADLCGGENEQVEAAVNDWIAAARAQFPPMDELAPEGE